MIKKYIIKVHFNFIFQIPPEQPAPAIATIAQTLISKRKMGPGVSANPNLSAVIEEDMSEANESLIQKDFVDAPVRRFRLDTLQDFFVLVGHNCVGRFLWNSN